MHTSYIKNENSSQFTLLLLLHVCFGFIWAFSRLIQFIFSLSPPEVVLFMHLDKCAHHVFPARNFALLDFTTYLIFMKLTFFLLCWGKRFHKKRQQKLEKSLFMLTKVILLKALFEEEIRRRRVEGYIDSHIYLYGWCWGWSIIYHFLLAHSTH